MSKCKVCGDDPCLIGGAEQPPPFTSVKIGDEVWVNIPVSLNWNWYSIAQDGMWCWEDLEHAVWPDVPERVEVSYVWGCDNCGAPWLFFEPLDFAHLLEPGRAGGGVPCVACGEVEWPRALSFACICDPTPGAPDAGRNPDCRAGGLADVVHPDGKTSTS